MCLTKKRGRGVEKWTKESFKSNSVILSLINAIKVQIKLPSIIFIISPGAEDLHVMCVHNTHPLLLMPKSVYAVVSRNPLFLQGNELCFPHVTCSGFKDDLYVSLLRVI